MLSGRPLSRSQADQARFVDRDGELARIRRLLQIGGNVALVGEPGAGKSTIVNRLLLSEEYLFFRDLVALDDLLDEAPDTAARAAADVPLEDQLTAVLTAIGPRVIVLDQPAARIGREMAALRDVLWAAPPQWVVAFRPDDRQAWLAPPLDVFFDVVELHAMPFPALVDLLTRRARDLPEDQGTALVALAERIVAVAPSARPGPLLAAARETLAAEDPERHLAGREAAASIVAELGDRPTALLAALHEFGPASASDPRLSAKVGVSRSRVAQILGELAERGLVVRAGRDGRRTLYEAVA